MSLEEVIEVGAIGLGSLDVLDKFGKKKLRSKIVKRKATQKRRTRHKK